VDGEGNSPGPSEKSPDGQNTSAAAISIIKSIAMIPMIFQGGDFGCTFGKGGALVNELPQLWQKCSPSGFSFPQEGHIILDYIRRMCLAKSG
jgi:hypothetical protein